MALNSGIHTYQILTNDDEVCIPSLSSILLAVNCMLCSTRVQLWLDDMYYHVSMFGVLILILAEILNPNKALGSWKKKKVQNGPKNEWKLYDYFDGSTTIIN